MKKFSKGIGSPEAIICDMSGEKTSDTLQNICSDIGITLGFLEEGTSWTNKDELYI